jgi:membrane protease YdiL (CAAX protease family)
MSNDAKRLLMAVSTAAILWFMMFNPWTAGKINFWVAMTFSGLGLASCALLFTPDRKELLRIEKPLLQCIGGIVLAFVLWGVFWAGDKISTMLFDFAKSGVASVYAMKQGLPVPVIGALLLLVIGPAEELFWRGYVQRTLSRLLGGKHAADLALLITTAIYTLVHIWSFNFMLIMAALVAGAFWGLCYRLRPGMLPALVVSHAVWDFLVFIAIPIQ